MRRVMPHKARAGGADTARRLRRWRVAFDEATTFGCSSSADGAAAFRESARRKHMRVYTAGGATAPAASKVLSSSHAARYGTQSVRRQSGARWQYARKRERDRCVFECSAAERYSRERRAASPLMASAQPPEAAVR